MNDIYTLDNNLLRHIKSSIFSLCLWICCLCSVNGQNTLNKHEYVDLGLPSGTLWATCNLGASSPEEYGDYFAWGETQGYKSGKNNFEWNNYKYCKGSFDSLTKYCVNNNYGTRDNKTELDLIDDAAFVNWGDGWRMPSYDQTKELIDSNYTTVKSVTQKGIFGTLITSKTNNNSIFLPAAGSRFGSSFYKPEKEGYYWTRNIITNMTYNAWNIGFSANSYSHIGVFDRYWGVTIRPVTQKQALKYITSIAIDPKTATLDVNDSIKLVLKIEPFDADCKAVSWESSNNTVATVTNGIVKAIEVGSTTITATTLDGAKISTICEITVTPASISSISLSPKATNINVDESIELKVTFVPENATNKTILWSSSNNNVASVHNGIVTGNAPGKAIIFAKSTDGSNVGAISTITVNDIKATDICLNKSTMDLLVGNKGLLTPTISPESVTNKAILWSTSNKSVATIDNGMVTAVGSGTTTITATTTDGTNLSATCQVSVEKKNQTITWGQLLNNVQYGGQLVELNARSSSGLKVKYKSNNEEIANLFDLGGIVYLNPGNYGKTTIVAYQEGDVEYYSTEMTKTVEIKKKDVESSTKTLVAYYSHSSQIDGIVAELAKQMTGSMTTVYTQKIEPTNNRINEANTNSMVRDSVMNVINRNPHDINSYPSISNLNVYMDYFDNVILVYPLWNSLIAAPMQTFQYKYNNVLSSKPIAYIEYELVGGNSFSSNTKTLRLSAVNIDNKEELIKDWLNAAEATGIISIKQDQNKFQNGIFDLQGRRVTTVGGHGLYIIKGKKIIK